MKEALADMENLQFRRATGDDFDAVMEMSVGIYAEMDYMPALYHIFVQSPDYVMFVGELEGKLVYLTNYHLHADKTVATSMSLRVHRDFRGRGLGSLVNNDILLHQQYPTVQRILHDAFIGKYWKERLEQPSIGVDILYKWNTLTYKLPVSDLRRRLTAYSATSSQLDSQSTVTPSYQQMCHLLHNGDRIENFLRKFVTGYFPSGVAWQPTAIEKSELKKWFNISKMCITLTCDQNRSIAALEAISTASFRGSASSQVASSVSDLDNIDILAISAFTSIQADVGVRADINFFGRDVTTMLVHLHSHLCHLVHVCADNCGIQINFPTCIDLTMFKREAYSLIGNRCSEEPFNNEQAILMIEKMQV